MTTETPNPRRSAVDELIEAAVPTLGSGHASHSQTLALQVQQNLQFQHDWSDIRVHTSVPGRPEERLARPVLSGCPPRRVYIHPDEQIEAIKAGIKDEELEPQPEWVFPSHLQEPWSLQKFGELFDQIDAIPPSDTPVSEAARRWRKMKRALLATVDDDSTVVYYIVHDGIVKPRQN